MAYHPYDGNTLTWGESEAPDLLFYTIYRDTIPDFQPSSENILQLSFDLEMVDDAGEDWNRVYYKISATDDAWQESEYLSPEVTDAEAPPAQFALYQNLPNPFNPTTKIMFEVPTSGGHVKLSVFDVSGRLLRVLKDEHYGAGRYEAEWNGRDTRGNALPSGVYFYRLESEDFSATKKMVLVK
ncbi:T9SS type A sorting domain-containing protein [bacterium]|nr:T9SS type A sorting domain-containing protein [bacterium]